MTKTSNAGDPVEVVPALLHFPGDEARHYDVEIVDGQAPSVVDVPTSDGQIERFIFLAWEGGYVNYAFAGDVDRADDVPDSD